MMRLDARAATRHVRLKPDAPTAQWTRSRLRGRHLSAEAWSYPPHAA